jgi:hypothetical protein
MLSHNSTLLSLYIQPRIFQIYYTHPLPIIMRFPTLLLTAFLALASAYPRNETDAFYLIITDIVYSSYYTFVSPSASGPKQGVISFTIENSDIDGPIHCKAVNSNPFAVFYASTEYECVSNIDNDGQMEKTYEGPYCWTNSVVFTFSTESLEQRILTVDMSWTCEK